MDDLFKSMIVEELRFKQQMSLDEKIEYSKAKIVEFVEKLGGEDNCFISFSGGKDSTVLLHLVRSVYPNIKAVFFNTGLEFPEIVQFAKKQENVVFMTPDKRVNEVWKEYGIPAVSKEISSYIYDVRNSTEKMVEKRLNFRSSYSISKKWIHLCDEEFAPYPISNKCCQYFKKDLSSKYAKDNNAYPIIGTMANESILRLNSWVRHSCNMFDGKKIQSRPLSIWLETDIWDYIEKFDIEICELYHKGHDRTGCFLCPFGAKIEDDRTGTNRFELLKVQHPNQYKALEKLGIRQVLLDMKVPIRNDEQYMKDLNKRIQEIENWYIKVGNDIAINGEKSKYWKYHKYFN